jgi:hypothetical protein
LQERSVAPTAVVAGSESVAGALCGSAATIARSRSVAEAMCVRICAKGHGYSLDMFR